MAQEIQFENDVTGAQEKTKGSDGRLNVSSRADSRAFYVSRDKGQAYVLHSKDADAATADLLVYLRNDSKDKRVYIEDIHISSPVACKFIVSFGDATTATGTSLTPVNLNKSSSNDADVTAFGSAAVGGVAASTAFASLRISASETGEIHFNDSLILGQNDNIVIESDLITSTPDLVEVDIYFFIE